MKRSRKSILLIAVALLLGGLIMKFEPTRSLRGYSWRTLDGNTYLVVIDDESRASFQHVLDGKAWPYPLNQRVLITPGAHNLDQTEFIVRRGHVYHFNYWGP